MSSGAVIGGFAAAFGTASALGVVGIIVHVCQYQPNARMRILERRRSFIERARQRQSTFPPGQESKAVDLEEIECCCPQLKYLGADKEPYLVRPCDRTDVCMSEWLEQKQRSLEDAQICIPMETSSDSESNHKAESQSEKMLEMGSSTGCSHTTTQHTKQNRKKTCRPILLGEDLLRDEICAICLDPVQVNSVIRVLKCGHAFHSSCIIHWLTSANRCPLCNTPAVDEEDINCIKLKRSVHGAVTPSIWPFPKPNLTEQDLDDLLFRSLGKVLIAVQSHYCNEEQAAS